jgi:hypothetical protein
MLRVLACDSAEIDKISAVGRHIPGVGGGMTPAAQRLFGLPLSSSTSSSSSAASSSGSARTCQDVRYPLNLRNERRAMEILLGITARSLSTYPTSLAQDESDLADEVAYPKFSNGRNAIDKDATPHILISACFGWPHVVSHFKNNEHSFV